MSVPQTRLAVTDPLAAATALQRRRVQADAAGRIALNLPELAGQDLEVIVRPARTPAEPSAWRPDADPVPPSGFKNINKRFSKFLCSLIGKS